MRGKYLDICGRILLHYSPRVAKCQFSVEIFALRGSVLRGTRDNFLTMCGRLNDQTGNLFAMSESLLKQPYNEISPPWIIN